MVDYSLVLVFFAIELSGAFQLSMVLWPLLLLLATGHVFMVAQNMYMHLSNRYEVLYVMKYQFDDLAPVSLGAGWRLSLGNQRRLQHKINHYLIGSFDLVGLIPPPRNESEKIGTESNLTLQEARYLIRTINDAEWKKTINDIIKNCDGFIVECNSWSDSLSWEVSEIIKIRGLKKIIFVADENRRKEADEVISNIKSIATDITNKQHIKLSPLMIHKDLDAMSFWASDVNLALELRNKLYSLMPLGKKERSRKKITAIVRIGLGYIWMISFFLAMIYFLFLIYKIS